eukprot:c14335_g2_i1 orf=293-496(+)
MSPLSSRELAEEVACGGCGSLITILQLISDPREALFCLSIYGVGGSKLLSLCHFMFCGDLDCSLRAS